MTDDDFEARVEEPGIELKFCIAAIPAMLLIALAFHASGLGPFLQGAFFAMPLHELGHATVAWLCGYAAIPTLWHTIVPAERGLLMPALALAGAAFYGLRGRRAERWGVVALAAAFVAIFSVWWAARRDPGRIPFGEQEGSGPSDAVRLVDWFAWTADQLVSRYVTLGVLCLTALGAVYAWGVWTAWKYANEQGDA